MSQFFYQQKQAWASLKKKPGFVSTIVATMSITLGTLLCVLTLAYVLIVSPLPYPKQNTLYRLDNLFMKGEKDILGNFFTYPGAVQLHKDNKVFSETAIVFFGTSKIESDPSQPNVLSTYVTPEWFNMFGATVALGRVFENTEAIDANNPVAVLSYKAWQNTFSADPNILDKKIVIAGKSFHIVGVLSESFVEPRVRNDGGKTEVFLPWDFNPIKEERSQEWKNPHPDIAFFGSLLPEIGARQAEQTLTSVVDDTWQDKVKGIEFFKGFRIEMKMQPLKSVILGDFESAIYLLLAAVVGLVLIALVNISNLFMSRTAEKQRTLAIQAAIGASKKQLFKSLLAETGYLMFVSIILALVVANIGFIIMQKFFALKLPRVEELSINTFTFAAAALIAIMLALFFAYLSSSMINYRALQSSLTSSGKGSGIQVSKNIRKILIVSQVAIVSVLVFINISIFKESFRVITQPLGFETQNTHLITLSTWSETAAGIVPTVNEIAKKLSALPQVQGVSQAYSPLGVFDLVPHKSLHGDENIMVQSLSVDNKYFDLIGQKLLAGDFFSETDINNANKVLIINDVYASRLAPNGNAVGMQVIVGDSTDPYTVIGVVKGIKIPGQIETPLQAFTTFDAEKFRLKLLVKLKDGQTLNNAQIADLVKEAGGQVGFWSLESLDARRNELLFGQFTTAITSSILVVISYLLAAIGLYGVLSYGTQLRRFELATRMAIGAKPKDIVNLIVKDNATALITGFVLCIIFLLVLLAGFSEHLTVYINSSLFFILIVTLVLVASVALFACYWPLRQFITRPVIHSLRGIE